ncbi:hypothetical protein AK830_g3628 [Neonectria ditissima]|uniref:Uncharacterized protein n=1 Tax=Neonectria ditissima TaxID=78410 RepID=A0A0P7BHM8_9HYPO|nr:hypothetical protein AK830_g3628 [Neonectria ditissima]
MNAIATQRRGLPLLITAETCSGGTYIVTGANTGLGFEAAKRLVALSAAKVVLAVRNVAAGETAKAEIEEATGKTGVAEVWALDLASHESVKAFANRAIADLERIDALIENAAVAMAGGPLIDGHVAVLTVNLISTLLLAVMLLPKMSEGAKKFGILPHIVAVTSRAGFDVREDWDKIKDDPIAKIDAGDIDILKSYETFEMSLANPSILNQADQDFPGVVLNLVCPGLCKTELSRNAPLQFREWIAKQHAEFGRTAEDGSRTLLYGAVAGKESHGCLLDSCEIADDKVPNWVTDGEGRKWQKNLWDIVANELESIEPGCVKKLLSE